MTAVFEFPLASETLTADEVQAITGCTRRADQVAWLAREGWAFVRTRSGDPVVGRFYARLRLAGIVPQALAAPTGWVPDFSRLG